MTTETRKFIATLTLICALGITFFVFLFARQRTIIEGLASHDAADAMEAMLNNEDHGCIILRGDHSVVIWNNAILNLTGYTKADIDRLGIEVIMPPEYRAKHAAAFAKAFEHPRTYGTVRVDGEALTKNQNRIAVQISVWMIQTDQGKWLALARVDRTDSIRKFSIQSSTQRVGG